MGIFVLIITSLCKRIGFIKIDLMKKIDDKIKSLSIELDKNTRLNQLDEVILDFEKNTDEKHDVDVSVDIQNATLHMRRIKKPYLSLATVDGKNVEKIKEVKVKVKE